MDVFDAPAAFARIKQRFFGGAFASTYPAGVGIGVRRITRSGTGRGFDIFGGCCGSKTGIWKPDEVGAREGLDVGVTHDASDVARSGCGGRLQRYAIRKKIVTGLASCRGP